MSRTHTPTTGWRLYKAHSRFSDDSSMLREDHTWHLHFAGREHAWEHGLELELDLDTHNFSPSPPKKQREFLTSCSSIIRCVNLSTHVLPKHNQTVTKGITHQQRTDCDTRTHAHIYMSKRTQEILLLNTIADVHMHTQCPAKVTQQGCTYQQPDAPCYPFVSKASHKNSHRNVSPVVSADDDLALEVQNENSRSRHLAGKKPLPEMGRPTTNPPSSQQRPTRRCQAVQP